METLTTILTVVYLLFSIAVVVSGIRRDMRKARGNA